MFLLPPSESQPTRHRRGTGVGFAVLAAVGLIDGGVDIKSSDSCGLRGLLAGCHAQVNASNNYRLSDYQDIRTQFVTETCTHTDGNFFLVTNELAALNAIQTQVASTPNRNWVNIQKKWNKFEQNFHILRDCNQMLISNEQLSFNFDSLSSLLPMVHFGAKSFFLAFFSCRMNILNFFAILLQSHLHYSLIPVDSLLVIL